MKKRSTEETDRKKLGSDSVDIEVLKKFFEQNCSGAEEEQVIEYFQDPALERILKYKVKEHWKEFAETSGAEVNSEQMLDKIYHKMHFNAWEKSQAMPFYRKFYLRYAKIAAAVLLPLFLLLGGWYLLNRDTMMEEKTAYAEIYSPLGARTHFELPDGSSGWLNSGSRLKFPTHFSGSSRDVCLSGEAYFDVAHNPKKDFVVNTGWSEVIALGTSFNVMAWSDEKQSTVTMESGLTLINRIDEDGNKTRISNLKQGEQMIYHRNSLEVIKHNVVTQYYTSWKDGKLIFRNESMSEILKKLERWYNVDFIVESEVIEDYRYRATFKDETLDEVLKLLEHTSPIGHEKLEREILTDGTYAKRRIRLFVRK